MHRVAGLLEQMDHQVDSLAQDEKDEENKHLKLQNNAIKGRIVNISPGQLWRQWHQ